MFTQQEIIEINFKAWTDLKIIRLTANVTSPVQYYSKIFEYNKSCKKTKGNTKLRELLIVFCGNKNLKPDGLTGEAEHKLFFQETDQSKILKCPLCFKHTTRFRTGVHTDCLTKKTAYFYKFMAYEGKHFCPLCLKRFDSVLDLIEHLNKDYNPYDLMFFGVNREILKRTTVDKFAENIALIKNAPPAKISAIHAQRNYARNEFHMLAL